ncbi:hypothetical protein LSAT2_016981 [Lamellibrachia satsuma]|nr:hypothetical protein LSAT2_016981 [Lamellibrachia satsuma]
MHLFRRKARSPSPSPSIEVPRLCLPRQKATTEAPSDDDDTPVSMLTSTSTMTARLKVPSVGRVRSSSFDSSSLKEEKGTTLQLPMSSQRSKSLDSSYAGGSTSEETASDRDSTSSLRIPMMSRYHRRRSTDIPRLCIHCVHIESLSSQEPSPASSDGEFSLFSCGDSTASADLSSSFDSGDEEDEIDRDSDRSPLHSCGSSDGADGTDNSVSTVTLAVPLVKLRSSSFDSSCMVDSPVLAAVEQERRGSLDMLNVPQHTRSSSVDVNLPTCTSNRYRAMTFIPKRVR